MKKILSIGLAVALCVGAFAQSTTIQTGTGFDANTGGTSPDVSTATGILPPANGGLGKASSYTVNVGAASTLSGSHIGTSSGVNTGDQTTISGNAGSSTLSAITKDSTTNSIMYPLWVTATSGNLAVKNSGLNFNYIPKDGQIGLGRSPKSIYRQESNELYAFAAYTAKDTNFINVMESKGTGTRSFASFRAINNLNYLADWGMVGSAATPAGIQLAGMAGLYTNNPTGMAIMADGGGYIKFATSTTAQKMVLGANGFLGIGPNLAFPDSPSALLHLQRTGNDALTGISVINGSNGTAAQTLIRALNDGNIGATMVSYGSGYTTSGLVVANSSLVYSNSTASFGVGTTVSAPLIFFTGGAAAANERARISSAGLFSVGLNGTIGGKIQLMGATTGSLTIACPAVSAATTITLPAGTTDFSATGGTSQVVKQTSSGGAFTVGQLATTDISNLTSTTYTPSISNTTNVAASTAYECHYSRNGTEVTVTGLIDIDITTASIASEVQVSLPVPSAFTAISNCTGVFNSGTTSGGGRGMIFALTAGGANLARFYFIDQVPVSNITYAFMFQYTIK